MTNDNTPPEGTEDAYSVIHKAVTTLQEAGAADSVIATELLGQGLFLRLKDKQPVGKILDELEATLGVIIEHVSKDD